MSEDYTVDDLSAALDDAGAPLAARIRAADMLGVRCDGSSHHTSSRLLSHARSPHPRLQRAVLRALTRIGREEALSVLAAVPKPRDCATARQLDFARRVIAHRIRVPPPPMPSPGLSMVQLPPSGGTPVEAEMLNADETSKKVENLSGDTFGMTVDMQRGVRIKLADLSFVVLFDHDLAARRHRSSLKQSPAILALIVEEAEICGGNGIYLAAVALTNPEPSTGSFTIWCVNGVPLFSGAFDVEDDRLMAFIDCYSPSEAFGLALNLTFDDQHGPKISGRGDPTLLESRSVVQPAFEV